MTIDDFQGAIDDLEAMKSAFLLLAETATYDEVRVMLVNRFHITMGQATDTISMLENATKVKISRGAETRDIPTRPPVSPGTVTLEPAGNRMRRVDVRREWLKAQVKAIQQGADMRMTCVMATRDRLELGLCHGTIPADRVKAGYQTCSPECQDDKRRLRREENAKKQCRFCGHGFTKKQREQMAAMKRKK